MPGLEVCLVFLHTSEGVPVEAWTLRRDPSQQTSQLFDQLAPVVDKAFKYLPTALSSGQIQLLQLTRACERVGFNLMF